MKTGIILLIASIAAGTLFVATGTTQERLPDEFQTRPDATLPDDRQPQPAIQPDTAVEAQPLQALPSPESDVESLRKQYVEMAQRRANLMDAETLLKAVEEADQSLRELRAQQALNSIKEQLKQLSTEYGDTPAGQTAAATLEFAMQFSAGDRRSRDLPGMRRQPRTLDDVFPSDQTLEPSPDGFFRN